MHPDPNKLRSTAHDTLVASGPRSTRRRQREPSQPGEPLGSVASRGTLQRSARRAVRMGLLAGGACRLLSSRTASVLTCARSVASDGAHRFGAGPRSPARALAPRVPRERRRFAASRCPPRIMPGSFDNVSDVVLGTDWRKGSTKSLARGACCPTPRVGCASIGRDAARAS